MRELQLGRSRVDGAYSYDPTLGENNNEKVIDAIKVGEENGRQTGEQLGWQVVREGTYPFRTTPRAVFRLGAGARLNVNGTIIGADDWNSITMAGKGWWKSPTPLARGSGAANVAGETAGSYSKIYWPCVIRTDNIPSPLNRYYLYYSTDHDATRGGIGMMHGPTPLGPFTNYGEVFVDLASSGGASQGQTETPSVVWDPFANNFRMFYHNRGAQYGPSNSINAIGSQSTLSATSTDGITWTKDPNFILDIPGLNEIHGDGHTGYFAPFSMRNGLYSYSILGGTTGMDMALWACEGRLNRWATDYKGLGFEVQYFFGESPLRYVAWHHSRVVESSDGKLWLLARLSDFVEGGFSANARIAIAPLSSDLRRITSKPVIIWTPTLPWESADNAGPCIYIENGVLYVYYAVSGAYIGVMTHVL